MNDQQIDDLIARVLREEHPLPEGFSDRLERFVDALSSERKRPRRLGWLAGAAASVAVIAGLIVYRPAPADTYTDPAQAAAAVEEALGLLAANYNKGLEQMARAAAEMERANETVFKTIQNERP